MKMNGFVLITLLILCHKQTLAEEGSKLALLAKEDRIYCMAEHSGSGKLSAPAIVLQTRNLSDIVQTVNKWIASSSQGYDFIKEANLLSLSMYFNGWYASGDWYYGNILSETDILPLLDYHWEDFPVHDKVYTAITGDNWDVTISIRARENVNVMLTNIHSLVFYYITLGLPEKDSQTHIVRLCPVGFVYLSECRQKAVAHKILFDESKWVHVTLAMRYPVLQLKLLETNKKVVTFLEVKSEKRKESSQYHLDVSSSSPAQFRIHDYYFLGIQHQAQYSSWIRSNTFKPTYYPLCISILSLIWPGKKESLIRVTITDNHWHKEVLMTIRPLEEIAWQEVRGIYIPKSRHDTYKITIIPEHTNYYLIGAIRECNPMGEVRVVSMSTKSREDSTFSCALLHNQKEIVSKRSVRQVKNECRSVKKCSQHTTTCDKFSITEANCTDALLCEQTSDCCCGPKYIKPCLYKDFEEAVNLTVASVGEGPNSDCIITHLPDPCFAENFILKLKIKRNDTWEEVTEFSRKRVQSVYWDNRLDFSWCSLLNNTYMFQIFYTNKIPHVGERNHRAEVIASLSDAGPPDPPLELRATNVNADSVNLTWLLPLRLNGKLRYFQIEAEPQETSLRYPTQLEVVTINYFITSYSREYNYLLKNLSPSTEYKISVRAHNGQAGQAAALRIRTPLAKPNIGPEFLKLQNSVTNGLVLIQLPPFDRNLTNESAYFLIGTSHSEKMKKLENVYKKYELLEKANIMDEDMCWFAAELNLLWDGPLNFTVGDSSTSMGLLGLYWNRPLNPEMGFTISLVARNQEAENFEYAVKSLEFNKATTKKTIIIAGIVIMLIICKALAASIFYLKRKKIFVSNSEETLEMELEKHSGTTDNCDTQDPRMINSVSNPASKVVLKTSVLVKDLEAYVMSIINSGVIEQQFSVLQDGLIKPCSYAVLPENRAKNRYQNIFPYDDNRVKLKRSPRVSSTDYINASYIDGYNSSKFYIATQGPKRTTLIDFWKMIWQENVSVIAMATNITEKNKVVCEQYWPELQQEIQYGPFSIFNTSTQQLANFTFRVFCVTLEGSTRMVYHLHFTSWPNHRVPYHIQPLAVYMNKLQATPAGKGPIVVHCSAGTGRTGTIILADMCLRMAKAEGSVDVLECMMKLRQQRVKTVGNVEQYKLVYLLLLECLITESTDIPCDGNFTATVRELYATGKLHNQFEKLKVVRWQDEVLKNSSTPQSDTHDLENDLIYSNLSDLFQPVYMDGFLSKNQFVVLGLPQKAVVETFWKMVSETKVSLIILLNDIDEVNAFCPSEAHSLVLNPCLSVEIKVEENYPYWKHYSFQISDINEGNPVIYSVSMLHFKGWPPSCKVPKFPETLLELWEETQRRRQKNMGPIVLLSNTTATSGLFAALVNILEKVEVEHACDVCEAVRTVHRNLDYFFTAEEQFLFLHDAVIKYLETYGMYANLSRA